MQNHNFSKYAAVVLITGCAIAWMVPTSTAQSKGAPVAKFEVASIRASKQGDSIPKIGSLNGGRLAIQNYPLLSFIVGGFPARGVEVVGAPSWVMTARYDLNAKAEGNAAAAAMWKMVLPLLEDRFKMKWHRETRTLPVYFLSYSKPGGKLPTPKAGSCVGNDKTQLPMQGKAGSRMIAPCGSILLPVTAAGAILYGGQVKMAALVDRLTTLVRRPVIDKTGFAGIFDLDLHFAVDDSVPGLVQSERGIQATDPALAPALFSALRDQLGLKLEAGKGPWEVIVIDSIERPSEN